MKGNTIVLFHAPKCDGKRVEFFSLLNTAPSEVKLVRTAYCQKCGQYAFALEPCCFIEQIRASTDMKELN